MKINKLFLLIILLGGVGLYVYYTRYEQSTPPVYSVPPVSQEGVYTDERYGFTFTYPQSFEILQIQNEIPKTPVQIALGPKKDDDVGTQWVVMVSDSVPCTASKTQKTFMSEGVTRSVEQVCITRHELSYTFQLIHDKTTTYDASDFYRMIDTFRFPNK